MIDRLKDTLNPSFAILFAVGADRLYKVVDLVRGYGTLSKDFYMPLTMVVLTFAFGLLSSKTNDQYMEKVNASAKSLVARLSYTSIGCVLVMFYFSADLTLAAYWWLGYAALCLVNAVWNGFAVKYPDSVPHVVVNLFVTMVVVIMFVSYRSNFSDPFWFYGLLLFLGALKRWQRRQKREFTARYAT
jgi:hypothetical protein